MALFVPSIPPCRMVRRTAPFGATSPSTSTSSSSSSSSSTTTTNTTTTTATTTRYYYYHLIMFVCTRRCCSSLCGYVCYKCLFSFSWHVSGQANLTPILRTHTNMFCLMSRHHSYASDGPYYYYYCAKCAQCRHSSQPQI